jgi:hypothetical protein
MALSTWGPAAVRGLEGAKKCSGVSRVHNKPAAFSQVSAGVAPEDRRPSTGA